LSFADKGKDGRTGLHFGGGWDIALCPVLIVRASKADIPGAA
jgi:hypothetical protein